MNYFFDRCFDKKRIKQLLIWWYRAKGESNTIKLIELLKCVGFEYATISGLSIGLEDLQLNVNKSINFAISEKQIQEIQLNEKTGTLTNFEKLQQNISVWVNTNEFIKQKVIQNFQISKKLNPLFLMSFSGARGNLSQVRQLVGMRGLMSDPNGQILEFPIRSNLNEGLTLTEYLISCYGARKGIVDTALRTATSGYLTRRLVDVAQHIIIEHLNCKTQDTIWLSDLKKEHTILMKLKNRLIGRILGKKIVIKKKNTIFNINSEINDKIAFQLSGILNKIPIRSPLTCECLSSVCQLCYG